MDEDVVHVYNGILLSHEKNEAVPIAPAWMDLEIVTRSKISQTEKDEDHMTLLIQNRNRVTDVENKLMVTRRAGEDNWETGIDIYILLDVK